MYKSKNIVIVGGGFAGTAAAKHLESRLPEGYRLVVVSEESYTTFNPMLPEAVGASIFPEHVVAPIREILRPHGGSRFVMGRVSHVDLTASQLRCTSLAGETCIPFAHLILAYGNRARIDLIPGMAAHALPLKTVGDALHIRNTVLRRLARIELETDPQLRQRLAHFAVIGGGFSGVEVAGELVDCLASIARYYPMVTPGELKVTVIQDGERLLPELPARLGAAAQRSLQKRHVEVRLGVRAMEIQENGVCFKGGEFLEAGTIISTIGTRANPLTEALGLPNERGRIIVGADCRVAGHTNLWAIGDCALVPNAHDQQIAPPTAQFAVREGRQLASNILATLAGNGTRPFNYQARGMMAAIGHMKGVAEVCGVPLSGLPAWLLWRAYYLSQMPTLGRKVRIFVEWTWGMFFPADITHLRYTRSAHLEGAQEHSGLPATAESDAEVKALPARLADTATRPAFHRKPG